MSGILPNKQQRQAIEAPALQAMRVVAGAGTGKTQVISQRYVHLLRNNPQWRPENILVLTFSEKAATEMRARIFRAVRESELGFTRLDLASAAISTFHSFGARLVREHSLRARIASDVSVLSEVDVALRMKQLQEEFFERGYVKAYGDLDPLLLKPYKWENAEPFEKAQKLVAQLLNQAVPMDEFRRKHIVDDTSSDEVRILAPLTEWLYGRYLETLQAEGLLDFDRLINGAADLLHDNLQLRESLHDAFKAILVDEYQDTNYAQEHLLKELATAQMANAMVVGDPRQAIYVWREARVENIAQFPGDPSLRLDRSLIENYRSLSPILTTANLAIAGYEFGDAVEFSADDELVPTAENLKFENTVVQLQVLSTREEEADAIAAWIRQAVSTDGWTYRDIAVLIRARTYLQVYTSALDAADIPYELSAGDAFYSRPEILDAVHLLNVCLDPANELSLARVLLSPFIGLSQAQIAEIKQRGKPLWTVVNEKSPTLEKNVNERLERLTTLYAAAQRERWKRSATELMDWLLRASGLMQTQNASAHRALSKLLAIIQTFEAQHPAASVIDVSANLITLLESAPPEKAPELNVSSNAVQVMTVHASKGLEFPVVLAIDSRQALKPNRDLEPFHDPDTGLVIPKQNEQDPRFVERVRRARNEARCLWYVSLTRAKKRLIVTATNTSNLESGTFAKEKTFFEELWNQLKETPGAGIELGPATPQNQERASASAQTTHLENVREPKVQQAKRDIRLPEKSSLQSSPTTFLSYQRCPAAFRFKYLARLDKFFRNDGEDTTTEGQGALAGTLFHRLAAAAAIADHISLDDLFSAQLAGGERPSSRQQAQVRLWFEQYLKNEIGQVHLTPNEVEVRLSYPFEFEKGILVLNGFADRLEPSRLVDFKTDADAIGLADRYGDQLRLYALMAQRTGRLREDAKLILYHVPTSTPLNVSFHSTDKSRLLGEMEAFTAATLKPDSTFEARPSHHCRWCQARDVVCRVGQEWATENGW